MKKILITAITILLAAGVNAQVGMPKELSCTETAFNFSFSLGTKWKFSTPKMGPVEVVNNEPYFIPEWSSKISGVKPGTQSLPFENLGYPANQRNYIPFGLKAMNKPGYLLPDIDFNFPISYTLLKPDFMFNSKLLN